MEEADYFQPKKKEETTSEPKPEYKQLAKKEISKEEYKEKYNPQLEKSNLRIVDSRWDTFLNVFFCITVLAILVGGGYFLYLVHEGKFQSSINQPITMNSTTNNQYAFNPTSNNQYTVQLNATIVIPNTLNINNVNVT